MAESGSPGRIGIFGTVMAVDGETIQPTAERWRERWARLCRWMGLPTVFMGPGEDLLARYQREGRPWHDAARVLRCLDALDGYPDRVIAQDETELAIWYADAVLDPDANRGKRESATVFRREFGDLAGSLTDGRLVESLILGTRHILRPRDADEALVMDIDLGELAGEPARYRLLCDAMRAERSEWGDDEYRRVRIREIESLLGRECIYHTNHYRKCFESAARRNLFDELKRW